MPTLQASASPWTTPAVIQPGDDIVYTVQAINSSGTITAATVGLTLTTPVGVTFDQCAIQAPFTGACSGLAGGASISLNETLAPTTTATITVRVKTAYSVAGNLVTGVVLGARDAVSPTVALQAGPATVETDVLLPALQLTLSDGLVSTTPGAEVTYQVTAANAGAARRTVQMTFTLPATRPWSRSPTAAVCRRPAARRSRGPRSTCLPTPAFCAPSPCAWTTRSPAATR
ncbi:MAG: hypothetical protein R3A10_13600 [Caldilineaceae bacterium]